MEENKNDVVGDNIPPKLGLPVLWIKADINNGTLNVTEENPLEALDDPALYSVLDSADKVNGYAYWHVKNKISILHGMLETRMLETKRPLDEIEWCKGYEYAYKDILGQIKEIFLGGGHERV